MIRKWKFFEIQFLDHNKMRIKKKMEIESADWSEVAKELAQLKFVNENTAHLLPYNEFY